MLPLWTLILAIGVEDVPNPRTNNSWVSDTAQVIPAQSEERLDQLLERIHQQTGAEVAVVTVHEVSGTPKQFATALFNHWGVGSAARNDGVLFLMVMGQRRLEVEVGYGLEDTLPDGWLGSMQTSSMVPRFKQSDFAGGLEVGVIAVGERLGASGLPSAAEVPAAIVQVQGAPANSPADPSTPWPLYALYLTGGLGLLGGGVRGARILHHKRCNECKLWRTVLSEEADDALLDAGQRREEELRSIDYDVFVCRACSSV
ncbi:MAG: TPM domain-containing protein, partial [Enhygromyxa sp.]